MCWTVRRLKNLYWVCCLDCWGSRLSPCWQCSDMPHNLHYPYICVRKTFKVHATIRHHYSRIKGIECTHSPMECRCRVLSSSSLLMLMTLTVGLARSEITMACRCFCETESSSQSGRTLQQFSSSSACSRPCSSPAVLPWPGHLAFSSTTSSTFFAVSAIFGDWHVTFWMFVFWEKLLLQKRTCCGD